MALSAGTRLGSYEIVELIGVGGIEFLIHVKPPWEETRSLLLKM